MIYCSRKKALTNTIESDLARRNRNWDKVDAHLAETVSQSPHGIGSIASKEYESGNWTPALIGATSQGTFTRIGKYTRIGDRVFCDFEITWTAKPTGAGAVAISGIPFSRASNQIDYVEISAVNCGANEFYAEFSGNSYFTIRNINSSGVPGHLIYNTVADNGRIRGKLSYLI